MKCSGCYCTKVTLSASTQVVCCFLSPLSKILYQNNPPNVIVKQVITIVLL